VRDGREEGEVAGDEEGWVVGLRPGLELDGIGVGVVERGRESWGWRLVGDKVVEFRRGFEEGCFGGGGICVCGGEAWVFLPDYELGAVCHGSELDGCRPSFFCVC